MRSTNGRTLLRRPIRTFLAVAAGAAVVATGLIAAPANAASPAGGAFQNGGQTSFEPGRYIVTLVDDSVATYDGGIPGYPGTQPDEVDQLNARSAPVADYSDYLSDKQQAVADAAGVSIDVSYTLALNAFSADLS